MKYNVNASIFGDYLVEVEGDHCTIRRKDGKPAQPTFYEMQHMKSMAFGAQGVAVEVFPAARDLVDGQNQRHLWYVPHGLVPNLRTGEGIFHENGQRYVGVKMNMNKLSARRCSRCNRPAYEHHSETRECPAGIGHIRFGPEKYSPVGKPPFVLAVVGSRTFTDRDLVFETLDEIHDGRRIKRIVSGGASGPDRYSVEWAKSRGVPYTEHRADWDKYGRGAGFKRNAYIIRDGERVCAFWDGESLGTAHSISLAKKSGKPRKIIYPRGKPRAAKRKGLLS